MFVMTSAIAFAQSTVTGVVTDKSGEPLVGASVIVKGTNTGTSTNVDGQYSIKANKGGVLTFSYVGYQQKSVTINSNVVNVVLEEDANNQLNEVVVVGYGTMTRKDVTSSITTVKAEDMNVGIYTDPAQMLQGKVPGLTIVQSSDPNGGTNSINLRGASTLNGSTAPLYVVDGIPGVDLSLIAPDDIESIDVLRDASATAIYGSKAANGVIIVTTKKGKEGRTNVTYSGWVSFENILKDLDVMSASELREYAASTGQTLINDMGADTNWADETKRTGFAHNHNLSISGGNGQTNYNASVNYMERDGVIRGTGMNRFVGRSLVQSTVLKDHLTFALGLNGSISNHWGVSTDSQGKSAYDAMYYYSPLVPVTNEDGSWYEDLGISQNYNPLSIVNEDLSRTTYKRIQATGKVTVKIIDGLLLNGNFSYQNQNWAYKSYHTTQSQISKKNGEANRNTKEFIQKVMELYANYDKTFNDVHKLSLMAGYSWEQKNDGDGYWATTYNFYDDTLLWNNIGLGNSKDTDCIGANTESVLRMISFYGRANYSFDSKYILQAAIRRDGSSAFGANHRWATFPSVSAAWRISDESFLKDTNIFDDLKVRVGYGVSGNSLGFDAFSSRLFYSGTGWFTASDGNSYHTLGVSQNANPDLKWERTGMFNVGIDFAFLKGRLNGTIEYYNKNTTDLIYGYTVSTDRYPVNWINANVGSMNNRGVEFTINAVPVKTRDFMWTSSLNLSHNRNRVTKLSNEQYSVDYINTYNPSLAGFSTTTIQRIIEGQPIGTFYMYEWAGYNENGISQFYAHDEETGERILNEDGTYATTQDPGEKDRTIVGNAQPKLNLGWNNTLTYKNWSLNAFFTGVFGQKIFNELRATYSNVTNVSVGKNVLREVVTEQKATDTMAQAPSDRYLENGSYFRLSSLTLGYTFKNFAGWLNNLHLYATCNNVFTITGYSGRDPEICLGGLTPGCDSRNTQYPRTRQFLFGATINF
jgi:iron complex outermembrane receptor protein